MRSLKERVKLLHQIAKENIVASQEVYKKQYDKKAKSCEYGVGEEVWMLAPTQLPAGKSKKMQINFSKLVTIKEKVGDTCYRVMDSNTNEEVRHLVHVDNLRNFRKELTEKDYVNGSFRKMKSGEVSKKLLEREEVDEKGDSIGSVKGKADQLSGDIIQDVGRCVSRSDDVAKEGSNNEDVSVHREDDVLREGLEDRPSS